MSHIDYTFTLKARDVPGMLVRITQVFARRGCNIRSLQVIPPATEDRSDPWSMIVVDAYDVPRPDQIQYQLEKLIDVHSVSTKRHAIKG
ncbi:MAG TPA: ACT domain-containing protein [Candidatus Saccharimonadales bacterium]|nr:ACT domain-containing protein [Candidatus Saccharimonadales bacterium]